MSVSSITTSVVSRPPRTIMPLIGVLSIRLPSTSGPEFVSDAARTSASPVLRPQSVTHLAVSELTLMLMAAVCRNGVLMFSGGLVSLFWMMLSTSTGCAPRTKMIAGVVELRPARSVVSPPDALRSIVLLVTRTCARWISMALKAANPPSIVVSPPANVTSTWSRLPIDKGPKNKPPQSPSSAARLSPSLVVSNAPPAP